MFQATRRRLALWYSAVTAVLLLLFASGVFFYVHNTLIERVDDTLNHVVEVVERSLVMEPEMLAQADAGSGEVSIPYRINLEASFRNNDAAVEDDRIDLEWFSPDGQLLWSTFSTPLALPVHPNRAGETVQVWPQRAEVPSAEIPALTAAAAEPMVSLPLQLRQITEKIQMGEQVLGYLRVSHPWFEVTKPTRRFSIDLGLGVGVVAVTVAAIGWWLSGLAMEPVQASYQRLKQFTADASHELRSPIATIQTNVQVALSEPDLSLPVQQQFQVVERVTRRLGRLVDDLLFLARQDSGMVQPRWQSCPLDALLLEAIDEQRAIAAEKGIRLALDLQEPLGLDECDRTQVPQLQRDRDSPANTESTFTIQGDWDQLARLFANLIVNAIQHTPAGGDVQVVLSQPTAGRHGASSVQIAISDSGGGIPAALRSRVFERFYRVDPARSQEQDNGSGLGLAIAQAIVENHHGQIQIGSRSPCGTIITVKLPQ